MTPIFTWVHLSDLHFLPKDPEPQLARRQADQESNLELLLGDLLAFRNSSARDPEGEVPKPDAVIITGDVANSGTAKEYAAASEWLLRLCTLTEIPRGSVYCIPGNHDIARCDPKDRDRHRLVTALREGTDELDDCLADRTDHERLFQRMRAFSNFRSVFAIVPPRETIGTSWMRPAGTLNIRIIGFNTALLAQGEDQAKLRVGEVALRDMMIKEQPRPEVVIGLTHHPLGWLSDEQELRTWMTRQGVHLHLYGHVHDRQYEAITKSSGTSIVQISTGPAYEERREDPPDRLLAYNVASLFTTDKERELLLRIWPRALFKNGPQFISDHPRLPPDRKHADFPLHLEWSGSTTEEVAKKTPLRATPTPRQPPSPPRVTVVTELAPLQVGSGSEFWSSFDPEERLFRRVLQKTTKGFDEASEESNEDSNERSVYTVRDPLRPFETQVGLSRSSRPGGRGGEVPGVHGISLDTYRHMYVAICDNKQYEWLRTVIAELATDPEVLSFIHDKDPSKAIRELAARNPFGSRELRQSACLFCKDWFLRKRIVDCKVDQTTACIIANDFPYGAPFHYVVMPTEPVHAWEAVEEKHLLAMNRLIRDFLEDPTVANIIGSASGVRVGFNSSLRHLVLGKKTRSSAGATIAHVHKQVWGMAASGYNLGDHLVRLCDEYVERDYLELYLNLLREAGFVLDEDDHVAIVVPLAQISLHEIHVMFKRAGAANFRDFTDEEIASFSRAEFIVTRLYEKLNIGSFNEVFLLDRFQRGTGRPRSKFRAIATFITREVDLAVSELSMAYVVDKLPEHTCNEARHYLGEMNLRLAARS